MTKEEVALQLTIEFKNLVVVDKNSAKNIAEFYNTIYDNIKTEHAVRHGDVNVLK